MAGAACAALVNGLWNKIKPLIVIKAAMFLPAQQKPVAAQKAIAYTDLLEAVHLPDIHLNAFIWISEDIVVFGTMVMKETIA